MTDSPLLKGWKDIAAFLGVHEDTAKVMYEQDGLPVTKIRGSFFAAKHIIIAWVIKHPNRKSGS